MSEVYNAANRAHIKAAAKAARLVERQRQEIISGIMSVASGRAWVLDLLEVCHIFSTSFQSNALQTAFAEGERNIGLRLLNDVMSACPDQYVEMMRERNARDSTADARRRAAPADSESTADEPDADDDATALGNIRTAGEA